MNAATHASLSLIFNRRSVRVFRPGKVPDEAVRAMLEAAMAAPSAAAKDPWRFLVVRDPATLRQLAAFLPHGRMLESAALGFVVCGDLDAAHDRQLSYLLQDCSAAIENLLLAAQALGLGACWLGVHPREDRVQKLSQFFQLPPNILPIAAVAVGLPGETKEARTRYQPDYVHSERW